MANPHAAALYVGTNHGANALSVGSTPGTAGGASMNGGAARAPGPFQPGSFQPKRVVNQTIGRNTNHSIPLWSLAKRFKNGWEQYFQKGQFVFLRTVEPPSFDRARLDTLFNLPLLNFYLAQLSQYWHDHGETKRAVDVAAEFVPHGVVLGVNGESASGASRRGNSEVMVNCTVAGEADTFNVWGGNVHDGDRLFWLYKQIDVRGSEMVYSLDFAGSQQRLQLSTDYVWQVVPYVCKSGLETEPLPSALRDGTVLHDSKNSSRTPLMGYARYVGRVQHAKRLVPGSMHHELASSRSLHRMVNLNQMTIFVDL